MTNDFNLNKVAQVQGIEVLNLNELANVLKPASSQANGFACKSCERRLGKFTKVLLIDDGTKDCC